jgi:hypothetical protein
MDDSLCTFNRFQELKFWIIKEYLIEFNLMFKIF